MKTKWEQVLVQPWNSTLWYPKKCKGQIWAYGKVRIILRHSRSLVMGSRVFDYFILQDFYRLLESVSFSNSPCIKFDNNMFFPEIFRWKCQDHLGWRDGRRRRGGRGLHRLRVCPRGVVPVAHAPQHQVRIKFWKFTFWKFSFFTKIFTGIIKYIKEYNNK